MPKNRPFERYIPFTSDYGFNITFGNEHNTLFLRRSLQAIIEIENPIESVVFEKNTKPAATMKGRHSVYDLTCRLDNGEIVIMAGGTGNPFFTTDTASVLRALEIKADVMMKGTRVDGIYTADPEKDKAAVKYDTITYAEAMEKKLEVMDMAAFALCSENKLPVVVFNMNINGNLRKVLDGEKTGTIVHE